MTKGDGSSAVFISALDTDDKEIALRTPRRIFRTTAEELQAIPKSPFAYWLSKEIRALFRESASFGQIGGTSKQGVATGNNDRFLRAWWEVAPNELRERWFSFVNGGRLSPFYGEVVQVIGYGRADQEGIKNVGRYGRGATHYFLPGLTWAVRSARYAPSLMAAGSIFSHRGFTAYAPPDSDDATWCALFNSSVFDFLYKANLGRFDFPNYEMGVLPRVPVPQLDPQSAERLAALALRGWSESRGQDTIVEVSHAFLAPAVLQVIDGDFTDRVRSCGERMTTAQAELAQVQSEIDELCFDLYGISDEDRQAIVDGFGINDDSDSDSATDGKDADDESGVELDPAGLAAGLVSWAVGVAVGRFDVRLATGEREWPVEPDPFDPLPVCSPAMLTGPDDLPLSTPPEGYPIEISPVLVDDPGHPLDLTARVRAVFEVVFGADADRWWTDVGAVLDPKNGELGNWLHKGFFDHHLKTHSKSRRRAPMLWPIGTKSGFYQVWLYAHRVTPDSLFRVLNDIVNPKITVEERRLTELRQYAGPSPTASQRRAIDTQDAFVGELREFRDRLEAVTPLWAPDLNDGIVIVLAPLRELFAHHKPWSNELKSRWKKLDAGDYDWAQLAMHLWPERVIPKCAEDRSLAIAHGLEDFFWAQDNDNADKWHLRKIPATPIDQLIAERTNPATTTALQQARI